MLEDAAALSEVKPSEVKPSEVKPPEVKPAEVKPAEVKPPEVKPSEVGLTGAEVLRERPLPCRPLLPATPAWQPQQVL